MFENFRIPDHLRPSDPRFGSGPSLVPVKHLEALAATGQSYMGTGHRKERVKALVRELQEGLAHYFNLPRGHEVVLGNGGATFHWDMIGLGLVEKQSLHFVCGEFSEKWFKAHGRIPWIKAQDVTVPYGQGVNPEYREGFDVICATLNETSTGVQLSALPARGNSQALFALDATSAAGQTPIDFNLVDVYYFSPQKVFASDGGLYASIVSPQAIERALRLDADKNRFVPESMRWKLAIENSRGNQTYNTPALATLFLFNEQVKLLNALGEAKVTALALEKAKLLYDWAASKPYLSAYVQEPRFRSQVSVTVDVDERYSVDDLAKRLKQEGAALDIEGYRKLGRNQLRIAIFHNVGLRDLEKLTQIISLAIESV